MLGPADGLAEYDGAMLGYRVGALENDGSLVGINDGLTDTDGAWLGDLDGIELDVGLILGPTDGVIDIDGKGLVEGIGTANPLPLPLLGYPDGVIVPFDPLLPTGVGW